MGRIHVLSESVANKIAAGEVVERPASVVKELLENSLDAGSTRIKIQVEAGGKKLIQITDNGCGMVRDDALLAFERHATSKIKNAEDLLGVATLGFRGEALPSIASVSRLHLETRAPDEDSGTVVEINGGKISKVEEAGLPAGTSITIRDLFFNTPARKKFLRAESTELSHIASLVTHYALAHPEKHFELHSATNAILVAPPVAGSSERVYQVFGKDVLDQLIPIAAVQPLAHVGLPQPPPWRREEDEEQGPVEPGEMRVHGFVSQFHLRFRQRAADPRPARSACAYRGLPQHSAAHGLSRGAALPRVAQRRSGRECAPLENRGALPPAIGDA
jgi:DNA mismatch repair protein MutL